MTETRAWPAYVAMLALVALLVAAYLAGRPGPTRMWITPEQAEPGDRVVVRYAEPRGIVELTARHAGVTYDVTNGVWTELEDGTYTAVVMLNAGSRTSEVALPGDVAPGHYLLCSYGYESVTDDLTLGELGDAVPELQVEQLCADLDVTSP